MDELTAILSWRRVTEELKAQVRRCLEWPRPSQLRQTLPSSYIPYELYRTLHIHTFSNIAYYSKSIYLLLIYLILFLVYTSLLIYLILFLVYASLLIYLMLFQVYISPFGLSHTLPCLCISFGLSHTLLSWYISFGLSHTIPSLCISFGLSHTIPSLCISFVYLMHLFWSISYYS